jgi:hypothetical protein
VEKKNLIINNSVGYTKIIDLRKLGIFHINIRCKRENHARKLRNAEEILLRL